MTFSFRYPPHLLHSLVEPQWLPRPRDERESSLNILEYEEERHVEAVRRIVLPKAPEPIGIAGGSDEMKGYHGSESETNNDHELLMVVPPPPTISFWDKYKPPSDNNNGTADGNTESVDNKQATRQIPTPSITAKSVSNRYNRDDKPSRFYMNPTTDPKHTNKNIDDSSSDSESSSSSVNNKSEVSSIEMQQSLSTSSIAVPYQRHYYSPTASSRRRRRAPASLEVGNNNPNLNLEDESPTATYLNSHTTYYNQFHNSSSSSIRSTGWTNFLNPSASVRTPTSNTSTTNNNNFPNTNRAASFDSSTHTSFSFESPTSRAG